MEFDQRYDKRYNSIDYEMEFEDMWRKLEIVIQNYFVTAFQILREYYDSARWEWSVYIS